VSAVLSRTGAAHRVYHAFAEGRFTLVTSEPVLAETEEVLDRPELLRTGAAHMAARELIAAIRAESVIVSITHELQLCRDPNDDMVIETAVRGRADVLVTADKDLLDDPNVATFLAEAGIRVLTAAQFIRELDGGA
jgi:putative PIN family toxin of toxin-antitoxin system